MDPFARHPRSRRGTPNENLRFGAEFADGSKVTRLDPPHPPSTTPSAPVLWQRGGGGDQNEHALNLWLWPLPPPGPVGFFVLWPRERIPETRHDADADASVFLDAALRVTELWPPGGGVGPGGGGTFGAAQYTFSRRLLEPPS